MNSGGKVIIFMLMIVTMMTFMSYKLSTMKYDKDKEDYESAVQYASQLATSTLVDVSDVNTMYDGAGLDVPVKLEALEYFRDVLNRDLKVKSSSKVAPSNLEVPLVGLVGNEYVIGMTHDGEYLPPLDYNIYISNSNVDANIDGTEWQFTMGGKLFIYNSEYKIHDDNTIASLYDLNDEDGDGVVKYYDCNAMLNSMGYNSFEEFKNYVVALTVDKYLNLYTGTSISNTANMTGEKLDFLLGKNNYTTDKQIYNERSALIEGPGMFAVIDVYKGTRSNKYMYERIAAFGGSELAQRQ